MIAWWDGLLGRVTMYRLVTLSLLALAVLGLVEVPLGAAAVPVIGATTPGTKLLALVASGLVCIGWSLLANAAFAALFRVRAERESAVITGLLLFFVLDPALDVTYLLGLAVAATFAAASKYLVAPLGRHLLNPAAFGAFAAYSLGLQFTVWWAGTPAMLPAVALLGVLIVIRIRHALLVAVYLVIAFAVTVLATGWNDTLPAFFGPSVFLAVFMLTEPLTLPPRRWQQLLVAAVVAVVPGLVRLLLPFDLTGPALGPITPQLHLAAPEAALLVGNVVAAILARRRGIRLAYAGRRQLTPTSWEFAFTPHRPLAFLPGQYLELTLPHRADSRGRRRTFSIASAPGAETTTVRLGLRIPADRASSFKSALLALEEGTVVHATGIAGDFTLPPAPRPVLLVAGGIGITPFIAHLEHDRATGTARDTVLVYAVSSTDDIAYAVELQRSGARVLLVAPEPLPRMPEGWGWLGGGPLTAEMLLDAVPDATARTAFLSGPPALIATLRPALRRAGVRRVRTDAFVGY